MHAPVRAHRSPRRPSSERRLVSFGADGRGHERCGFARGFPGHVAILRALDERQNRNVARKAAREAASFVTATIRATNDAASRAAFLATLRFCARSTNGSATA